MTAPGYLKIALVEHSDFYEQLTLTDDDGAALDLTDYEFEMAIADKPAGTGWGLTCTRGNPSVGDIVITGTAAGVLTIHIAETAVDGLSDKTRGWFNLNAYNTITSITDAWLCGDVTYERSAL